MRASAERSNVQVSRITDFPVTSQSACRRLFARSQLIVDKHLQSCVNRRAYVVESRCRLALSVKATSEVTT